MNDIIRGVDKDKIVSTLDDAVEIRNERNCGNTTRQVNYAIDKLFDGYCILIKGHADNGNNITENQYLLEHIIDRLNVEHGYIFNGNVKDHMKIEIFGKFKIINLKKIVL